eukprot:scaffold55_cov401-Prasinococcus_capsulatus_cf.AAC.17
MERPARRQVPRSVGADLKGKAGHTMEYNFWHGKSLGGRENRPSREDELVTYKCFPSVDTGRTRAVDNKTCICVYFAQGACALGPDCTFLHRLPTLEDEKRWGGGVDCFGRQRFGDNRDDMSGVGSFNRNCRSLYVNYMGANHLGASRIKSLAQNDFGMFGPLEEVRELFGRSRKELASNPLHKSFRDAQIYMVHSKNICFARYKWRCSAEFAKEAMSNRSFTGSDCKEVLRVKWTFDDPNPVAQRREKRNLEQEAATAVAEVHAKLPKQQRIQREFLLGGEYPDTDEFYQDTAAQQSQQQSGIAADPSNAAPASNVSFDVDEYPVFEVERAEDVLGEEKVNDGGQAPETQEHQSGAHEAKSVSDSSAPEAPKPPTELPVETDALVKKREDKTKVPETGTNALALLSGYDSGGSE